MSEQNSSTGYLKGLNERQVEAVRTTEGPLLILAGAGAGKTKTITHRILHLIKKGVDPEQILAITFTNKAAKEMRERVMKLLDSDRGLNLPISTQALYGNAGKGRPFLSTFHSLGVLIIKDFGTLIGIPRHFAIYDRSDSRTAIKEAITLAGQDPKKFEPGKMLSIISREKGNFVSQLEYEAKNGDDYMGGIVAEIWKNYDGILKKDKALDFDDLLFKATALLASNEQVREHYQRRWRYVSIDEYQDTNEVQYTLSRMLVGSTRNIAVVGDPDQLIYGWRGANLKNILRFEEDYPEAKVVLLEENYRSTQTILAVANDIISKNVYRKKKNLFTRNITGDKISIYAAYDEGDEASFVGNTVRDLIRDGVPPEEIAVLYRANFQSRALEEAFLTRSLPYQLLGTKFFERKEVKDVLSYARAALNPESMADIKRVINTPARGIGKVSLLKVLEGREADLPAATRMKIFEFKNLLKKIAHKIKTEKTSEAIKFIIKESGIEEMLKFGKEADDDRLENVQELVTLAGKYDAMASEENSEKGSDVARGQGYLEVTPNETEHDHTHGMEKLLEEAALASDQDKLEKNEPAVKLMTVHSSKGLEFDYVFITGLEQELFPHVKGNEESLSPEEQEEERRLFYVALTRARKKIHLAWSNVRTIFGSKQVNLPSEFIADIDPAHIEQKERVSGIKSIFIDF
ncbi:MAG: UvrD-helicase domain-containing protein [Patescibacteria group bacterium]